MTNHISFRVFLARLLKAYIVKYGGAKPFCLGPILGQFAVPGLWAIIHCVWGWTNSIVSTASLYLDKYK